MQWKLAAPAYQRAVHTAGATAAEPATACADAAGGRQDLVRVVRNHMPAEEFAALKTTLLSHLTQRAARMPRDQQSCLFCVHVLFNVNGGPPVLLWATVSRCLLKNGHTLARSGCAARSWLCTRADSRESSVQASNT